MSGDEFHDGAGNHRLVQPPDSKLTPIMWAAELRRHKEGHGLDSYVAEILGGSDE